MGKKLHMKRQGNMTDDTDRFGRVVPAEPVFKALPLQMQREGVALMRERAIAEGRTAASADLDALLSRPPCPRCPFLHPSMVRPYGKTGH